MTYPASRLKLKNAVELSDSTALQVMADVLAVRDASLAGPVKRHRLRELQLTLHRATEKWMLVAAVPGIAEYAKSQAVEPDMDYPTVFNSMVSATTELRDWIHSNFPKDVLSGADLSHTTALNGDRVELTFTTAQLAGFRTQADAVLATIA